MEDEKSCRVGCMDEINLLLGVALDYFKTLVLPHPRIPLLNRML